MKTILFIFLLIISAQVSFNIDIKDFDGIILKPENNTTSEDINQIEGNNEVTNLLKNDLNKEMADIVNSNLGISNDLDVKLIHSKDGFIIDSFDNETVANNIIDKKVLNVNNSTNLNFSSENVDLKKDDVAKP